MIRYLRFVHLSWLLVLVPLFALALMYRLLKYRPISYTYALSSYLRAHVHHRTGWVRRILWIIRCGSLVLLLFLIAQPQWADVMSRVEGQGIDIMLVLDVSGSMVCFDDVHDRRTRLEIAQQEAIRFVNKRTSDQVGLVLFGNQAVSRLPLTLDKPLIKETILNFKLGDIDYTGTVLAQALLVAASRLKQSKATSKVIILLTDGEPSQNDVQPDIALEVTQRLGIRIYTIGIGNETNTSYREDPFFGVITTSAPLNTALLEKIAHKTGGAFFQATKPQELRLIYDRIDSLEKSSYQTTVFSHYFDIFVPLVWLVIGLGALELIISTMLWLVI
jgi:Ca-activated chloride channel family protein